MSDPDLIDIDGLIALIDDYLQRNRLAADSETRSPLAHQLLSRTVYSLRQLESRLESERRKAALAQDQVDSLLAASHQESPP